MLHELIFALYGCPGTVFGQTDEGIVPSKEFSKLHPSELAILEELCLLGSQYKLFSEFIKRYDGLHSSRRGISSGMYLKALANGIDAVLETYRKDLILLERETLNDSTMSLFKFQYALKKYTLLFPAILRTIQEVETKKLHGCPILNVVNQNSGVPIINSAINKILQTCHKPLFRQLTSWMVYGQLFDPHGEFFIRKKSANVDAILIGAVKQNESQPIDVNLTSLQSYEVSADFLPNYFSSELALKILFVGSSVCLFTPQNVALKATPSMFDEKEMLEFSKMFSQLQNKEEFSSSQFKSTIDLIRICAAEHLWRMVVCQGDLSSHLRKMKDFFLLGRSELFSSFIDLSCETLNGPASETTEWDLNNAFCVAATGVFNTNQNDSDLFSIALRGLDEIPDYKKEAGLKVWSLIELNYEIPWPLHTILTPDILEKYNRIFRFLLTLKSVEKELHASWLIWIKSKRSKKRGGGTLWNLWMHMCFLIDNLQSYLQNDVLESQFTQLLEQVEKTKDFEAVCHAHKVFLTSVMSLTFLTWRPVYHCLMEIMNSCRQTCQLIKLQSKEDDQERQNTTEQLAAVNFQRLTMLLYKNLSVAHNQLSHVNLGMILLKLDFNGFFTQKGHLGVAINS